MRILPFLAPSLALTLLAACGAPDIRYAAPSVTLPAASVPVRYASVEVREITLPLYAREETIFTASGVTLDGTSDALWADDPVRATTLQLSRNLGDVTNAQVAAEPWPFVDRPSVRVDVRLEELAPGLDGVYRLTGQYYVAPDEGPGTGRSRNVALAQPFDLAGGAPAIAVARGALIAALARDIARNGLR